MIMEWQHSGRIAEQTRVPASPAFFDASIVGLALCGLLSCTISQDWTLSMELWTEYEGRTIDGAFPLKKLLLPEGRSAFFSTSNGKGVPTVIRLIASHFDEEEILARWRGVEAL